jgi:hypothetical protein
MEENKDLIIVEESAPISLDAFMALDENEIDETSYTQEVDEEAKQKTLAEIGVLCAKAEDLDSRVKAAETIYNTLKDSLAKLMLITIPETLESVGLKEIKLSSGKRITVYDDCRVNISDAKLGECMQWMRKNKFEAIIKNQVTASFSKGDDKKAIDVYRDLLSRGYDVNHKEDIHPATLKAFMKEQLKKGALSSEDKSLFSVYEFKVAKIK